MTKPQRFQKARRVASVYCVTKDNVITGWAVWLVRWKSGILESKLADGFATQEEAKAWAREFNQKAVA